MVHYWGITQAGKKISSDISSRKSPEIEVLLTLHGHGICTTEDVASRAGVSNVWGILKKLKRQGLVKEISSSSMEEQW